MFGVVSGYKSICNENVVDEMTKVQRKVLGLLQSTDHELVPARNASLAAMQGFANGSNVLYYPT
jgi:hypothetical protein